MLAALVILIYAGFLCVKYKVNFLPYLIFIVLISSYFNPITLPLPSIVSLILCFSFCLITSRKHIWFDNHNLVLILLALYFLFSSLIVSLIPSLSALKIITYLMLLYVVFVVQLNILDSEVIFEKIFRFIAIVSGLFIPFSSGYYENGLFMGLFNHSQSIVIYLTPIVLYLTVKHFEQESRVRNNAHLLIIIAGALQLILSLARTGIFAFIVCMILYILMYKRKKLFDFLSKPRGIILIIIGLLAVFSNLDEFSGLSSKYIYKNYQMETYERNSSDNILGSRMVLYENSINNFMDNPLFGVGFGIYIEDGRLDDSVKYIPGTDIVYSMESEKGNTYLMLLEEGGVVGLLIFAIYVTLVLFTLRKQPQFFIVACSIFIMNVGESTYFSASGPGSFQVLIISCLIVFNACENRIKSTKLL